MPGMDTAAVPGPGGTYMSQPHYPGNYLCLVWCLDLLSHLATFPGHIHGIIFTIWES